jgi:hypothetical protein
MLAKSKTRLAEAAGLLAIALSLTACGAGGGNSNNSQSNSSLVDTGQAQNGTPSATAKGSTSGSGSSGVATATAGPGSANVKISANQATLGNLTLTLSVETAHRMVTPNSPTAASAPTPQGQQSQGNQGGAAVQDMVLGSQTQQISKNLDASQGPPPDPKEAQGDFIRHVAVQVKDKNTGQVVPYLLVSVDLLRDGRPIQYDQPLVAMVPVGGSADQMHYGNNIAFPGKGNYQLFVRIAPSPLLGNNAPPTAQFDVSIE